MDIVKIHFGATKPNAIDYRKQTDGFAEVWIYKDIHEETDADGNSEFVADGVFIRTALSKGEVEAQMESYFKKEEPNVETVEISREDFDLLDVEDNVTYHIIEEDGTLTIKKGVNR